MHLRVLTLNIWNKHGDPRRFDLIALQEVVQTPGEVKAFSTVRLARACRTMASLAAASAPRSRVMRECHGTASTSRRAYRPVSESRLTVEED